MGEKKYWLLDSSGTPKRILSQFLLEHKQAHTGTHTLY